MQCEQCFTENEFVHIALPRLVYSLPHDWVSRTMECRCTSLFELSLSLGSFVHSAVQREVHPLILPIHRLLYLPLLLLPSTNPRSIWVHRFCALITCPKYCSFLLFTVSEIFLSIPTSLRPNHQCGTLSSVFWICVDSMTSQRPAVFYYQQLLVFKTRSYIQSLIILLSSVSATWWSCWVCDLSRQWWGIWKLILLPPIVPLSRSYSRLSVQW